VDISSNNEKERIIIHTDYSDWVYDYYYRCIDEEENIWQDVDTGKYFKPEHHSETKMVTLTEVFKEELK
jgi:hypothetical protein